MAFVFIGQFIVIGPFIIICSNIIFQDIVSNRIHRLVMAQYRIGNFCFLGYVRVQDKIKRKQFVSLMIPVGRLPSKHFLELMMTLARIMEYYGMAYH